MSDQTTTGPVGGTPVVPSEPAKVRYEDFAKLDLRVARVLEAREHPNASKLLLLKIRVGSVE